MYFLSLLEQKIIYACENPQFQQISHLVLVYTNSLLLTFSQPIPSPHSQQNNVLTTKCNYDITLKMETFDLRLKFMLLTPFLVFKLLFHFLLPHTLKFSYTKLFLIPGISFDLSILLKFSHTVFSLPGIHVFQLLWKICWNPNPQ